MESTPQVNIVFGQPQKPKKIITTITLIVAIIFCYLIYLFFIPPFSFSSRNPAGLYVEVKSGMSLRQVANLLYDDGVIKSPTAFVTLASLLGDENSVSSGMYFFKTSKNIWTAEKIIANGEYGIEAKKITFPEGFTNTQIADRLEANLPGFNRAAFSAMASTSEGYLYPETYFFLPSNGASVIFEKLRSTFDEKTADLKPLFDQSLHSKDDIVTMASILEREVKSKDDKKIVSDILWRRLKIGMPLQVDATLAYERHKDSYTLTTDDLRKDSSYNTYTRKGLPPTPISNPGLDSIDAALEPTPNQYVYFLTDKEGKVYYAKTYDEHLKNKAKYLK